MHLSQAETLERLATMKEALQTEMRQMEERCKDHRQTLSDLKVQLYAKFGNNINLEADED